jgi:hypothetical protein
VHKVESITGSLVSTSTIKPIQLDKNAKDSRSPEGVKRDAPVLSTVSTEGSTGGYKGNVNIATPRKLTSIPLPGVHQQQTAASNVTMADTKTVVTGAGNSSWGGKPVETELSRVQGALAAAGGAPQVKTAQHKSEKSPQPAAKSIDIEFSTDSELSESSLHEGNAPRGTDHPGTELDYEGLNIQEIIRAITGEELASVGKEILESDPVQEAPPEATATRRKGALVKVKRPASSQQKMHLSSSRESLVSNSSIKRPTKASVTGRSAKVELPQKAGVESGGKSKLPRKAFAKKATATAKVATKTMSSHKQAQGVPHLGPETFHSSKGESDQSDHPSRLGRKAEAVESPRGTRKSVTVADTLRKKVREIV